MCDASETERKKNLIQITQALKPNAVLKAFPANSLNSLELTRSAETSCWRIGCLFCLLLRLTFSCGKSWKQLAAQKPGNVKRM